MIARRHALAGAALLCVPAARAEPRAGPAERRAIAAYRPERDLALEAAIQDAAGFPVPVEVAWDQLTVPGDAPYSVDEGYFGTTFFVPVAAGLKAVACDTMGRDALRRSLTAIRVRDDPDTARASHFARGLTFEGGILDENWRPFVKVDDFDVGVAAVVEVLEETL